MDDALAHRARFDHDKMGTVLILVVMDDALALLFLKLRRRKIMS